MLAFKRKQLLSAIGGLDCASQNRLARYRSHLVSDKDPMLFDDKMRDCLRQVCRDTSIVDKEIEYLDSIGFTQSRYEWKQMESQLQAFTQPNHDYFGWNVNYQRAKKVLLDEISHWQCRVLDYSREPIQNFIPKLSTHAGFSYILTGKRRKGDYVEGMSEDYRHEERLAMRNGTFAKPILLGSRTQASGAYDTLTGQRTNTFKWKTRLVSMIDWHQIMAERKFQYHIQRYMSNTEWYAGGKNDVDIAAKIRWWHQDYGYWTSIDYSHFDQSISDWLIMDAFDVLKSAFHMKPDEERLYSIIMHDFISKMFVSGGQDLIIADKGVPSGSMFTQIIDSICNRLMILTYLISKGYDDYKMMVMGDDNVIFSRKEIDLGDLSSYLEHNFGTVAHPDKCVKGMWDTPVEFLSRFWSDVIYRTPGLLISKLCYPEHYREYAKLDEHPITIIRQYWENFPGGMACLLDRDKFYRMVQDKGRHFSEGDRILTGLGKYRYTFDRRM